MKPSHLLIDSNIIIYAAQSEHDQLRHFIEENAPAVSAISYVEVLGYHELDDITRAHFEAFFAAATVLPLTQAVLEQAARLRQSRHMGLGDSLIAATCLIHNRKLVSRNDKDFSWVPGLKLLNPFTPKKEPQ